MINTYLNIDVNNIAIINTLLSLEKKIKRKSYSEFKEGIIEMIKIKDGGLSQNDTQSLNNIFDSMKYQSKKTKLYIERLKSENIRF